MRKPHRKQTKRTPKETRQQRRNRFEEDTKWQGTERRRRMAAAPATRKAFVDSQRANKPNATRGVPLRNESTRVRAGSLQADAGHRLLLPTITLSPTHNDRRTTEAWRTASLGLLTLHSAPCDAPSEDRLPIEKEGGNISQKQGDWLTVSTRAQRHMDRRRARGPTSPSLPRPAFLFRICFACFMPD